MRHPFDWPWIEEQVARSIDLWNGVSSAPPREESVYTQREQEKREQAYDRALKEVEREARRASRMCTDRRRVEERLIASFARFAAVALGLEEDAIELLTRGFLPLGMQFARWSRRFDPRLGMDDIVQACRNTWTACGLQPLLGERMELTPSIVGYSMLYPYSDNYLDGEGADAEEKLRFSRRFLARLRGDDLSPMNQREHAIWDLVALVESQYPRAEHSQVFDCMIAIHRAQEESIAQLKNGSPASDARVLAISCAKGGSSVLADACLCHGWLDREESEFAFDWGVLLQIGDDLQDVREDVRRGSRTLFTRAVADGAPLDALTGRLLNMSDLVSDRMDRMPHGSAALKGLLRMSWRSLIVMAVAESQDFFSAGFAAEMEQRSPFRFGFLRARQKRLAGRRGLYAELFRILIEPGEANATCALLGLPGPASAEIVG